MHILIIINNEIENELDMSEDIINTLDELEIDFHRI